MTIQHTAVFHCQECGQIVYQPRGTRAPVCCGNPTVCAVPDLVREAPECAANSQTCTSPPARHCPADGLSISLDAQGHRS
jgi:hypothetical protein